MRDFDLELDRALDALGRETGAPTASGDDDLEGLLEVARRLQTLPGQDWPDPHFVDRLVSGLGRAAPSRRRGRGLRRRSWIATAVAVSVAAAIVLVLALTPLSPLGSPPPVSARTLARHAAAVSAGRGLPPIRFTEVVTSRPSAVFQPAPPPTKVTENVAFASASRWRVDATIVEANGAGVAHLTTIRNGTVIAAESVSATGVRSAWTVTTHAGSAPGLPAAGAYGMVVDPTSTLSAGAGGAANCTRSLTLAGHGPSIDGRPTRLLQLGPDRCPSAAIPESAGPATFTVDSRTSLVLRALIDSNTGSVLEEADVTELAFGGTFAGNLFTLPKPAAAPTTPTTTAPSSTAPPPSASPASGLARLQDLLGHRPLVPASLPPGLRQGRITPQATDPTTGRVTSFTITYDDARGRPALQLYETPAAGPSVRYPGRTVQIRPGQTGTLNTGPPMTILWWIDDGVYLSLQQGGQSAGVGLTGQLSQQQLIALAARIR